MSTTSAVRVPIGKRDRARLQRLALRYGLSLPRFAKHVLEALDTEIPEEHIEEYEHPQALRASVRRALRDAQEGRLSVRL